MYSQMYNFYLFFEIKHFPWFLCAGKLRAIILYKTIFYYFRGCFIISHVMYEDPTGKQFLKSGPTWKIKIINLIFLLFTVINSIQ